MRRILLSAIKILVSAALLYLALRKANFADLASRIDLASAAWLALAVALTFFQIFIGVLRWRIVSAECGAPLPIRAAMRYNVIGTFFNQTLPSTVGGDAWYYITQVTTWPVQFLDPKLVKQHVLAIYFDKQKRVTRIANYGIKDGRLFDFVSRTTPTGGADASLLKGLMHFRLAGI